MNDTFPDAKFGNAKPKEGEDADPDDEEMAETPPDVIAQLGFDPKEPE